MTHVYGPFMRVTDSGGIEDGWAVEVADLPGAVVEEVEGHQVVAVGLGSDHFHMMVGSTALFETAAKILAAAHTMREHEDAEHDKHIQRIEALLEMFPERGPSTAGQLYNMGMRVEEL